MSTRRASFVPPFCPNPNCDSHRNPQLWQFKKKGFYCRQQRPRRIQRYVCQRCRRNFSTQTFSTRYWLKRSDLLEPLFWRILACSAYRQIAHEFDVAHSTIQHQVERLGRHCLLLHERLRPSGSPAEPVVLDGLRLIESGHYWPFDLNIVVGVSHFVYGFQDAELRRSGAMRPDQERKRASLEARYGRPDAMATRKAVADLVARLVPSGSSVLIRSDEHLAYPLALRQLTDRTIVHERTSSKIRRTGGNPLFPVNLADLLLRHTGAHRKRQTLAFSRRRQVALYRAAIFAVWRNYVKFRSERRRDAPPGVRLGAIERRWTSADVLRRRLFPWRAGLSGWLERCYFGRIPTRCLARCRAHRLRYAI